MPVYGALNFEVQVSIASTVNAHVNSISFGGVAAASVEAELGPITLTYENALPNLLQDMTAEFASTGARIIWNAAGDDTQSVDVAWPGGAIEGSSGSDTMDPRAALVLRKVAPGFGRSGRGRCFLPGVNEEDIEANGYINHARLVTINNHAQTFADALDSPGPGLESYPLLINSNYGGTPTGLQVMQVTYAPTIGWVRRRLN